MSKMLYLKSYLDTNVTYIIIMYPIWNIYVEVWILYVLKNQDFFVLNVKISQMKSIHYMLKTKTKTTVAVKLKLHFTVVNVLLVIEIHLK